MKISRIIQRTNLRAIEHIALSVNKGLQERGHQCRWVSLNTWSDLEPLQSKAEIPCLGVPYRPPRGMLNAASMRAAFRVERRNAFLMTGTSFSAMLAVGRRQGEPRMVAVHCHLTGVKPAGQRRATYASALRCFHAITIPTNFARRDAEEIYPPLTAVSNTTRYPVNMPPLPSNCERMAKQVERFAPAPQAVAACGRERVRTFLDPESCNSQTLQERTSNHSK